MAEATEINVPHKCHQIKRKMGHKPRENIFISEPPSEQTGKGIHHQHQPPPRGS